MEIFQLVYGSHARRAFTRPELSTLLNIARARNTAAQVTGMLLYHDENFLQVLEGNEVVVEALYEKIRKDPRHAGCMILHRAHVKERLFKDWTMAFRAPTADELREAGLADLRAIELRRLGSPKIQAIVNAFAKVCNLAVVG